MRESLRYDGARINRWWTSWLHSRAGSTHRVVVYGQDIAIVPALPVIFPSSLEYPLLRMLGVKGYFML